MSATLPPFIRDISITLSTAGAVVLGARVMQLPLLIGYLFAGVLIGPHVNFFPSLIEAEQLRVLSELGVLFLLFGLGLEFSFKKLGSLGTAPLLIGVIEVSGMVILGTLFGVLLWLPQNSALVLGCMLAISSTGVIVKIFQEKKLLKYKYAGNVVGTLIVEDIFAILFLLGISLISSGEEVSWSYELIKLSVISTTWIVFGLFLIPRFFIAVKNLLSEETLLMLSIGGCLAGVLFSVEIGISTALAAFLMGAIFGETEQQHRIEEVTRPVRNLFSSIFFVAVGMLLDPRILMENWLLVLMLTLIIVIGKFFFVTFGSILAGVPLSDSIKQGTSMAQIGEFSIIIASLAVAENILPKEWEGIIIASAVASILITPLMFSRSESIVKFSQKFLSQKIQKIIKRYTVMLAHFKETYGKGEFIKDFSSWFIYGLLVTGIMHGTAAVIEQYWGWQGSVFSVFIGLLLSAPFFIGMLKRFTFDALSIEKRSPIIPITFGLLTILLFSIVAFSVSGKLEVSIFSLVIFSGLTFFLRTSFKDAYTWIEREWVTNQKIYDEKDIELGPWEENLSTLLIGQNSNAVEKTIQELELRSKYGVTVIALQRGRRKFIAPSADMRLLPFDKVLVLGSEQEVHVLSDFFLCDEEQVQQQSLEAEFTLASYEVQSGCPWDKHTLRDINLAATIGGIVVGVERKDEKIVSPQADFEFNAGDFVWVVIEKDKVLSLRSPD